MFRRVILYFPKIKVQQKFSLTPLLVPSWNHPLTKTKFPPPIFTTQQQVLTPYQPLQTRPTNFFSLQNLKLVGWAQQLRGLGGGAPQESLKSLQNIHMGPPLFNLSPSIFLFPSSAPTDHKTFTLPVFSSFFHSRHFYRILLLLFLSFIGQPAFPHLCNMAASPNPWT